jgi:acyl-CoA thioester hydrolase
METFEKIITVSKDDLDELKHVNNVRYVQWIQDIAKEHWQTYASKAMQESVVWVVMNHNITYKTAAVLDDQIKINTFIQNNKGATCTRVVEMHNTKTNRLLLYSETKWCLLNADNFRPIRISKEIEKLFSSKE